MKRKEAILHIEKIKEFLTSPKICWGKDDNKIVALDMAIEALFEPINCVKCKHYYETEDDTDVHGHCRMDTAHTMKREEAIKKLQKQKAEYLEEWVDYSGVAEAFDMAIEALQFVKHFDLLKEFQSLQEVVRCNNCKWYQGVHGVQGHAPCEWFNKQVLWNDFCSNGELCKGDDTE